MFLKKLNRLGDVGSTTTTRFLRRFVSGPLRETKGVDPNEVNDLAQQKSTFLGHPRKFLGRPRKEWRSCLIKLFSALEELKLYDVPPWPVHLGTDMEAIDDWLVDEYINWVDHQSKLLLVRKRIDLGDSLAQEATGCRLFKATEAVLADYGKSVKGSTFAIEGFGNVGLWISRLVHEAGGKVVAVSDVTGALKNKEGIDITALIKHMDSKGNCLADFSGGGLMDRNELLTSECDVLIPGALCRDLNRKTAADVKAKFVMDASDYTNHIFSYRVLSKKGVVTLEKPYAKAAFKLKIGYKEWLKSQGFTWVKAA